VRVLSHPRLAPHGRSHFAAGSLAQLPAAIVRARRSQESRAACWECNVIGKHARTHGVDPFSGLVVPLFHPRQDRWRDHFEWSSDFLILKGKTPRGWATIRALGLNGARYRAQRRLLRQAMAAGGLAWP
jgi:hypothetical protein